jgi:hypothetical protein
MKLDPPRLSIGGLSGRVYVTTHGQIVGHEGGRELIQSEVKYDVTEQFYALADDLLTRQPDGPSTP